MTYRDICRAQLPGDEGRRNRVYKDQFGNLSAGVGRNLDAVPFSDDEIDLMFENDLKRAEPIARTACPSFDALSDNRKAVLVQLAFNMGNGVLAFHRMRAAIAAEDFEAAANELRDSAWFKQIQASRSERLIDMMRTG